eukprot:gnl/MRDRNA2_/MRDRNA2_334014_c0_seq1.p1 gnl/MRDRNA2_/MRDRNA2_334014_c0~~gnl/MRDRNA2_/MRDRNA2_334014_c0_seq1.p1  ORF type:complete len:125 (-),score=5.94 gnl/MRDRNA2_/MRDRNA2_334014_c0_seq1:19-354(-)
MAFASYGFATFLFGGIYDAHSHGACVQNDICHPGNDPACMHPPLHHTITSCCLGSACTSLSFGASAAAAALSVCCYLGLAYHAKERYALKETKASPAISLLSNPESGTTLS